MASGAFSFLLPPGVPVLPTAPPNPQVGEMYFDSAWSELLTWNGTTWVGTQDVTVSTVPPTDGSVLWVDLSSGPDGGGSLGPTGPTGPAGTPGPTGPTGPAGSGGTSTLTITTPEAHGAVGDGTADDTVALQAAINSGQPVFFAGKIYKISSALTVHSGTRLIGSRSTGGAQSVIRQSNPTAHCLAGVDVIELGISDLRLQGPNSGAGDGINLTRNTNAATNYINLSRVYIHAFGRDGVSISNCIVSTFDRVICESNLRYGFNLYGVYKGSAGTSVALNGCYANNNVSSGFYVNSMTYMGFNGCASEGQPVDYDIVSSQSISFTGCGSEVNEGFSWRISDECYGVGLYSCWNWKNSGTSVLVTGSSRGIVIAGFVENELASGASLCRQVDAGCSATVISGSNTAPDSYAAGTTTILDDGVGTIATPGWISTAGITSTGDVTLNTPPGQVVNVTFDSTGKPRWTIGKGNGAETGSNAGSDLVIAGWDDAGEWLNSPIVITRQTGAITLSAPLSLSGAPTDTLHAATKQYVDDRVWFGTQAQYDAIPTKDPTVLYAISG